MSDVTVAPAGGAPAAAPAAAPANEVPINPNPTSVPNPVGSQAPDKPVGNFEGSPHRPQSRREAIEAAFQRASNPTPAAERKPAAKPAPAAEAKPGHNNPPEETPKDKPIDLRKRPTGEEREPQPRDRGRFAPREQAAPGEQAPGQQAAPQQRQAPQQQPQRPRETNAPYAEPHPRMSEMAKRDWPNTPESVRGDFHRLAKEAGDMYRAYRPDHDVMNTIRPFHAMATQHGTTLEKALTNYVSMEQKLRADPIAGLDLIVHNLGLKADNGQRITLRDIAYHVLSQSPEQLRATQLGNTQQAAAHQIGALHQKVDGIESSLKKFQDHIQFTYTRSAVDQFAASHPRFDELGPAIEQELKFGFDLETAYRRAEMLRPTTHAAQTRTTPAQTRPSDRSINGAPDVAPSNGASRRPQQASRSTRDAVANAIRRVNGI